MANIQMCQFSRPPVYFISIKLTEPMGKVSPKFPTMETGRSFTFSSNTCVTLLCPAQAFPTPLFRYLIYIIKTLCP